jgi:hypothetical protein
MMLTMEPLSLIALQAAQQQPGGVAVIASVPDPAGLRFGRTMGCALERGWLLPGLIALILGSTLGCAEILGAPGTSRDASTVPEDLGDVPIPDVARVDVFVDSAVPVDADELRRYVDVRPYPVAEVRQRIRPSCPDRSQVGCDVVAMRGAVFDIQTSNGAGGSATARGVSLSSFALDRYEVTVARFRRFVDAGAPSLRFPIRYPGGVVSGLRPPSPQEPAGAESGGGVQGPDGLDVGRNLIF